MGVPAVSCLTNTPDLSVCPVQPDSAPPGEAGAAAVRRKADDDADGGVRGDPVAGARRRRPHAKLDMAQRRTRTPASRQREHCRIAFLAYFINISAKNWKIQEKYFRVVQGDHGDLRPRLG